MRTMRGSGPGRVRPQSDAPVVRHKLQGFENAKTAQTDYAERDRENHQDANEKR